MKERHLGFLNLILFAILLALALTLRDWKNVDLLWSGAFGALIALFLSLGSWMLISRKNLKTICTAFFVKKLRISCSYLYKIKVDDSYLLVKSKKHKKYQPVGGNFKRNKYSNAFLQSVILEEDEAFKQEMCAKGFAAGNPRKPRHVVEAIRNELRTLFLLMARRIENGDLSWEDLSYEACNFNRYFVRKIKNNYAKENSRNFHFYCQPSQNFSRI